jgi:hypothetical protein
MLPNNLALVHRYDEAMEVIRNGKSSSLGPLILESMLAVGEHRDFNRWTATLQALERDFGVGTTSTAQWNAQIAARDYAGARQTLRNLSVDDEALRINAPNGDLAAATMPLLTYWLLGDEDQWMPLLDKIQAQAEMERDVAELEHTADLLLAYVSAARGQGEETRRMVRRWRSAVELDRAELAGSRHYACRALGMVGATSEAVECLRSGLVEPSYVVPFIEPYLPYYDPIRGKSGFVALLAEIEA